MAEGEAPVRIDVWSDVVCPYCYVGKRHIEAAIARAETAVEITYRAFQLHPQAPADQSMPIRDFWPLVYPGHPGDTAETDAVLEPIIAAGRAVGLTLDYSRMWSCNVRRLGGRPPPRGSTQRAVGRSPVATTQRCRELSKRRRRAMPWPRSALHRVTSSTVLLLCGREWDAAHRHRPRPTMRESPAQRS